MTPVLFAQAAGVSIDLANTWADVLSAAMLRFGIVTPTRQAMFIAQCGHESGGFERLVESLNYTPAGLMGQWSSRFPRDLAEKLGRTAEHPANQVAIANHAYGGRLGNEPFPKTHGWTYRGRGLIQITGRDNYARAGIALGLDLLARPELLELPQNAALSAANYWLANGLNALSDARDVVKASAKINTGNADSPESKINGLLDRQARYTRACRALGV